MQPRYAKFYNIHWQKYYDCYADHGAVPYMIQWTKFRTRYYVDRDGTKRDCYVQDLVKGDAETGTFVKDISKSYPQIGGSVAMLMMQFLLFMGFLEFYLVGFDCTGAHCDNDIYYPPGYLEIGTQAHVRWHFLKKWIDKTYPKVKIFNVNPVMLKNLMDGDIYT